MLQGAHRQGDAGFSPPSTLPRQDSHLVHTSPSENQPAGSLARQSPPEESSGRTAAFSPFPKTPTREGWRTRIPSCLRKASGGCIPYLRSASGPPCSKPLVTPSTRGQLPPSPQHPTLGGGQGEPESTQRATTCLQFPKQPQLLPPCLPGPSPLLTVLATWTKRRSPEPHSRGAHCGEKAWGKRRAPLPAAQPARPLPPRRSRDPEAGCGPAPRPGPVAGGTARSQGCPCTASRSTGKRRPVATWGGTAATTAPWRPFPSTEPSGSQSSRYRGGPRLSPRLMGRPCGRLQPSRSWRRGKKQRGVCRCLTGCTAMSSFFQALRRAVSARAAGPGVEEADIYRWGLTG